MIKSTNCFFAATFAAISAVTAFPCQAETVGDLTRDVIDTNQIIYTEPQDINNSAAADRSKDINNSKSFTVSETTTIPANSSSISLPTARQPLRSNPLGCRFFYTPSMQQ
jgi:hypothetical protein